MKKALLFVLIALMSVGLVFAGGQGESSDDEVTEIVWWTHQRHDMDFMRERVEEFNTTNPHNIRIDYVVQTEEFQRNLELAYQAGDSPDIFSAPFNAKYYVDRGMAYPLDDFITDDIRQRYGNFLEVDVENYVDGSIYTLANSGVNFRLVYNQDLFDLAGLPGPPQTLDQMVEYAARISEAGRDRNAYGFALNLTNPFSALFRSLDQIAKASDAWPYDYTTGEYDFERIRPLFEAYRALMDNGGMFPGVVSLDIDPLRSQFAAGNIGMYISGNWEPGVYAQQFPTDINWAAVPVPTYDGVRRGTTWVRAGRWQFISSQTDNVDAAWQVFEWFHSAELLREYHERGYGFTVVPATVEEAADPDIAGVEYFRIDSSIEGPWPLAPHELGLVVEGPSYYDVIASYMVGTVGLDTAIADLDARYNAAVARAIASGDLDAVVIPDFDPMNP